MHTSAASPRFGRNLIDALSAGREPLLFGVRLWASVCLALFVAFWLELDNPFWAGTSAAIVCSAASWGVTAQGLVPHDRHPRRRHRDRGAFCSVVSRNCGTGSRGTNH